MRLFLFTNNFPYGLGETFLANEAPFLSAKFDEIVFIPLYKDNEIRTLPKNSQLWETLLDFCPKNRKKLLLKGIFNLSPLFRFLPELFEEKVYLNGKHFWNYGTSLLLFRAIFSKKTVWEKLFSQIKKEDKLYFYWGDKSALIIPFLKKHIDNQVFVRFHGSDLYQHANNGYIPFRKYLFPKIDFFVPISQDGKEYLLQNYSKIITLEKIYVSRLGVSDNGINFAQETKFHLFSCSNVISVKRIDLIISALQQISFPLKWTHTGAGVLFDQIKEKAKHLPANVEVEFKGAVKNAQVIDFYRNTHVDLFINVSESEGVPVSIMEALSFGAPVMATDVGGTAEIVDNQVGKLLPKDVSASEIAAEITLFANSDLSELRKNARARWDERCNAEKNYTDFVELITK
ncbi:MAG: glycosyltransferase [Prevotellaceae bacterium]|jgi:glycosyltransferase involved in cell wall biosynthesis|nr:glycosyltransferase [Prevotellaceae bacterium]